MGVPLRRAAAAHHAGSVRAWRERAQDGPVAPSPEAAAAADVAERLEALAARVAQSHGELAQRLGRLEHPLRSTDRARAADARGGPVRPDR